MRDVTRIDSRQLGAYTSLLIALCALVISPIFAAAGGMLSATALVLARAIGPGADIGQTIRAATVISIVALIGSAAFLLFS